MIVVVEHRPPARTSGAGQDPRLNEVRVLPEAIANTIGGPIPAPLVALWSAPLEGVAPLPLPQPLSFKTASVGRSQVGSDLRPPAASTRNRKLQDGVLMVRRPS